MNYSLLWLEIIVVLMGLFTLLADIWVPGESKKWLAHGAAAILGVLALSALFQSDVASVTTAFNGLYVQDDLATFFKVFFLAAGAIVLLMSAEYSGRFGTASTEFYALVLFALVGMMLAASANDFVLMYVALELITVTFYILTSYQRNRSASLEAGVKYLIMGALSSGFMVFGIALVFGTANTTSFTEIIKHQKDLAGVPLFLVGLLFVLVGLGFKIAAVPFQMWAPDVYQGSPAPATAFLAVGSKAAGFVLLLRVLFAAVPAITAHWHVLFAILAAATILYGSLCAIPQRSVKRLMGYSSIANAGYLLLGISASSADGVNGVMYYLLGYLFTVLGAFTVLSIILSETDGDDITALAGLGQRSPLLAGTLTLAMASLAGIPPLAGFFGKFLLLKSVLAYAGSSHLYVGLVAVALVGVVISLYYYFGVVRSIYWGTTPDLSPITLSPGAKVALLACIAGMIWLGTFPNNAMGRIVSAGSVLKCADPLKSALVAQVKK
ncbi:MAG TPA: NADH-quinone oxidoreductase subunit N [Candidatus Limnocylindria bacterium]|nr:NADH-quinone oxidoreductase subunit N [Candidatus Limnocylindria bacterium]